ncbi:MAG: hypothetical protein ABIO81_07850 [Ginsengibacter sp.]
MEENKEYTLWVQSLPKDVIPENEYNFIKEENEKLKLENVALKKNLQNQETHHRILYNQWNQLNASVSDKVREMVQLKLKQNPRHNVYQYVSYALLLIIALLIAFNYISFSKKGNIIAGNIKKPLPGNKNSVSQTAGFITEPQIITTGLANKIADKNNTIQSDSIREKLIPADPQEVNKFSLSVKPEPNVPVSKNLPRYIVKVKSFFHNKPDSNTRRNIFVLPWKGEYGILTALDDRNNFIYIVFTNHAGRTSKGWILKRDLEPLKL